MRTDIWRHQLSKRLGWDKMNIHTQLIQRSLFSIRQMPEPMQDFFSYLLKKEAIGKQGTNYQ